MKEATPKFVSKDSSWKSFMTERSWEFPIFTFAKKILANLSGGPVISQFWTLKLEMVTVGFASGSNISAEVQNIKFVVAAGPSCSSVIVFV